MCEGCVGVCAHLKYTSSSCDYDDLVSGHGETTVHVMLLEH